MAEEAQLALHSPPDKIQTGYLLRNPDTTAETVDEVIAMPIVSTETGSPIGALVLGFKPVDLPARGADSSIKNGIWAAGIYTCLA